MDFDEFTLILGVEIIVEMKKTKTCKKEKKNIKKINKNK